LDNNIMLRIDPSLDEEYDYNVAAAASGVGGGSSSKPATTPTPTSASAAGVRQNQSYNHSSPPNPTTKNHYDYYSNMMMSSADEPELLMPVDESKDDSADLNQTTTSAQDALLDLAELEELQNEAEKCKSLGNKHMASQEYLAAYHSYSAALQLSPVGPSSHVFLSNRAAALLSLKRYRDAATDARRAIALAPTFGKAHARLGQALYFLKEYDKAKAAYEDALRFEPDNPVTQTYWEKAVQKLERQQQRQQQQNHQQQRGVSDISSTAEESSTLLGGFSVATDRHLDHRIVDQNYNRGNHDTRATLLKQVTSTTTRSPPPSMKESPRSPSSPENLPSLRQPQQPPPPHPSTDEEDEYNYDDDPEFQEAMRIQQRANAFLANKKYRQAIEEYTAALFLVPDDVHLSSDLHLGRAHALNGSRRHEAARNDAILALKLKPSPAGYSTLAKTLFYLGEYQACVDAFADCVQLLPPGEKTLGLFDQAYLEKAQNAITEEDASLGNAGKILNRSNASSASSSGQPQHHSPDKIPKLPPPRFVPREEALMRPIPAAKSMPKSWPTQSSRDSAEPLRCGKERQVVCYSEALGIKLNRGPDGIVRVLKVAHTNPQLLRQGSTIQIGDIIREAAGVDLRRPITNIMWGDTV
jgi:tetratricopeptide (TPR) repeat protein